MDSTNFVDLLNSQQDSVMPELFPNVSFSLDGNLRSSQPPLFSTQATATSSFCEDSPPQRKGRKKWSPSDDLVLVSAWLNTSKDAVVSNEQKAPAFWKRIADYYAASPKVERGDKPEALQCKQRFQKMNVLVCKFYGSYAAATRQKTSGQNEADTVKLAHEIFYHDHKIKFNLHHAWEELRYDQKWCEAATCKIDGSGKKRKCDNGPQSESSQAASALGESPTKRPPGVKASKAASGKRSIAYQEASKAASAEFLAMCSIKERDLAVKERDLAVQESVKKMDLLDRLIAKPEPLSESEEALKQKLITEMLSK